MLSNCLKGAKMRVKNMQKQTIFLLKRKEKYLKMLLCKINNKVDYIHKSKLNYHINRDIMFKIDVPAF